MRTIATVQVSEPARLRKRGARDDLLFIIIVDYPGGPLVKLPYTCCFFSLILCFLVSCTPQTRGTNHQESSNATGLTTCQGTVVHKSNRQHTITLKIEEGNTNKKNRKKIILFNHRTRGLEYCVKGKQVQVTCTRGDNKTWKAVAIEPGKMIYASGVTPITVSELKKKIDAHRDFILIDTRSPAEYSRCHLPSAISMDACASTFRSLSREIDRDEMLIFYCGWPDCHRSISGSKKAAKAGFDNIRILQGGLQAWVDGEYPTIAADEFVQSGNLVLLDLRPSDRDRVRRIEGSVSVPLPLLADRIKEIPDQAPVVVYGQHLGDSLSALKLLRAAGFTRAAMIEGNFKGWIQRQNRVVSGPVQTAITWKRPRRQDEVSATRFLAAKHNRARIIILDVRTDNEVHSQGWLANSVHIPLSSLNNRMNELDKQRLIYCAAGPRAELASRMLRNRGYRAFFLATELACDGKKCRAGREP